MDTFLPYTGEIGNYNSAETDLINHAIQGFDWTYEHIYEQILTKHS